jgi:hypothetical protein
MAAPIHGSERDTRRDSRAPPQLVTRWAIVMSWDCAKCVPFRAVAEGRETAEFLTTEQTELSE